MVKFWVLSLSHNFLRKNRQNICHRNPAYASLDQTRNSITKNLWDCWCARDVSGEFSVRSRLFGQRLQTSVVAEVIEPKYGFAATAAKIIQRTRFGQIHVVKLPRSEENTLQ